MLQALLIATLGLHLLLVDVAMAGPLACVWLEWRGTRRGDQAAAETSLKLARATQWALAGGIVLGLALLGARWLSGDERYLHALANIPRSRLWFAGLELLFFFGCMGLYVALWNRWRARRLVHRALAVAAATNLLVHFPALFVIISMLPVRTDAAAQPLDSSTYRQLLFDPEVLARVVHVWTAALVVTAALVMELALRGPRDENGQPLAGPLVRRAAWLALVPTVLQLPTGLWLVLAMPETARRMLMGGDLPATVLFGASVLLSLLLMHSLAAIALGNDRPADVRRAIAALLVLVLLMTGTRWRVSNEHRDALAGAPTTQVVKTSLAGLPIGGDLLE